jgi:hypothetical protein
MKRTGSLTRRSPLRPGKGLRSGSPLKAPGSTKAKKVKRYAAHLRSPYFRALRMERFRLDDFRCQGMRMLGRDAAFMPILLRCEFVDESRTGKGLHPDHRTYARFGAELVEDLVTLCRYCHMRRHALEGKRIRRMA